VIHGVPPATREVQRGGRWPGRPPGTRPARAERGRRGATGRRGAEPRGSRWRQGRATSADFSSPIETVLPSRRAWPSAGSVGISMVMIPGSICVMPVPELGQDHPRPLLHRQLAHQQVEDDEAHDDVDQRRDVDHRLVRVIGLGSGGASMGTAGRERGQG
jgi:hypothetical protein